MTIHFPDVSHYQAGLSLKGAAAVIAKATQGSGYTDPAYTGFRAQAAGLGIPFCAYHWLDTSDAGAQARHCFSVVGPDTPLMVDDEQQRIVVPHTLEFVAAYRSLGGRVVLEYAPHWVWTASGRPNLIPFARAGLGIVSSAYTTYSEAGPGWGPYGGVTPLIWQYADNQPFNGRRVDFNAFRGSGSQLAALFGTPSSGDDMTPAQEYVQHVINYRLEALISGKATYTVPPLTTSDGKLHAAVTGVNALAAGLSALTTIARGIAASTGTAGDAAGVDQAELQAAFQAAADALKPVPTPPPTG